MQNTCNLLLKNSVLRTLLMFLSQFLDVLVTQISEIGKETNTVLIGEVVKVLIEGVLEIIHPRQQDTSDVF